MESILTSTKKLLGIPKEYEHFDADIIMHINSVFMILTQLGVGPAEGFIIMDEDATWDDFTQNKKILEPVKSYMFLKVKLLFDSSTMSSTVIESYNRMIAEFEWRLNVAVDNSGRFGVTTSSDGIKLTDRHTKIDYELYIENSRLKFAEEDEE